MSEAEAEVAIAMARKSLDDPDVHRYFNYYFWAVNLLQISEPNARRPPQATGASSQDRIPIKTELFNITVQALARAAPFSR
ncbi:hypothetical protein E4U39_007727 [Claviceps sp. Clav50 group G5]|nr:hypothetical protein E4U39_007727 [Claviceps sp. Clav50 group G5]